MNVHCTDCCDDRELISCGRCGKVVPRNSQALDLNCFYLCSDCLEERAKMYSA